MKERNMLSALLSFHSYAGALTGIHLGVQQARLIRNILRGCQTTVIIAVFFIHSNKCLELFSLLSASQMWKHS